MKRNDSTDETAVVRKKRPTNGDRDPETGRFASGCQPGPGRPKGSLDRLVKLRDLVLDALDERGGLEYLRGLDDREFVGWLRQVLSQTKHLSHSVDEDPLAERPGVTFSIQLMAPDGSVVEDIGTPEHPLTEEEMRNEVNRRGLLDQFGPPAP